MALSVRTLAIAAGMLLSALAIAFLLASNTLLAQIYNFEKRNALTNLSRAMDALQQELDDLGRTTADWSAWDETYKFIGGHNPDFVKSNLDSISLSNLRLDAVLFADIEGRVTYGGFVQKANGLITPMPERDASCSVLKRFVPRHPVGKTAITGLLPLARGHLLVSIRPVTNSRRTTPVNGSVMMGRFLGSEEVARLSRLTHLRLQFYGLDDPSIPLDAKRALRILGRGRPTIIRALGKNRLGGYAILADITGKPAVLMHVPFDRPEYRHAKAAVKILMLALITVGLAFVAANMVIMHAAVFGRLERLSSTMRQIGQTGDISLNVDEDGNDEVAGLARTINWMLASLRESQGELEGKVRERTEELAAARENLEAAYHHEHRIANTLQEALMSDANVALPGYRIAARYKPGASEAEVGGDFYDIFEVGYKQTAIALGDVSGKGLAAAVYTAMAKYMLRAYAHENPEPSQVLERLNIAAWQYIPEELFITIFLAVLEQDGSGICYANGGHDPPLLYKHDSGKLEQLEVTGAAIGVQISSKYEQRRLETKPGDLLVVYTDGITEAGLNGEFFGIGGLSQVMIEHAAADEQYAATAILSAAEQAAGGSLHDDAAVLLVKTKCQG